MTDAYVMSDDFAWQAPEPYTPKRRERCSHCHYEPASRQGKGLCSWCQRVRRLKDRLPTTSEIEEHQRREWAKLSPNYMAGNKHRRRIAEWQQGEWYDTEYDLPRLPIHERCVDPHDLAHML